MENLREVFVSLGFGDVSTLLTSGNVIFSSKESNTEKLAKEIELALKRAFDTDISVAIRTVDYVQQLVKTDPFKNVKKVQGQRLHVTFLKEQSKKVFTVPYESPNKDYGIVSATSDEVFLVVNPEGKTTDAMTFLDKEFGKAVTTRTWNTVTKISMVK